MGEVVLDRSMSLDGFITGLNPGPGQPLGEGGERIFACMEWGAETSLRDDEIIGEAFKTAGAACCC